MTVCTKCGTQIEEGIAFCPNCGTAVAKTEEKEGFVDKVKGLNNTTDTTSEFDAKDIADNKGISVLSYLGPLVFVPMFARKESKYARFHATQGLTLMIVDVAYGVIQGILMAILRSIFPWKWEYGYLGGRGFVFDALSTILSLVWIAIGVLAVIGFINALTGKAKELPLIGKIKFLK